MKIHRINKFLVAYACAILGLGCLAYALTVHAHYDGTLSEPMGNGHYASDIAYVDLPRVSLNLASGTGEHPGRLRMDISLEVEKQYAARLEGYVPRITEKVADYARGLDYDQISQPQAAQMIRAYLLEQVNAAATPVPIVNVLFRQYIVI